MGTVQTISFHFYSTLSSFCMRHFFDKQQAITYLRPSAQKPQRLKHDLKHISLYHTCKPNMHFSYNNKKTYTTCKRLGNAAVIHTWNHIRKPSKLMEKSWAFVEG